mmetsp:Transcript_11717/g.17185  ORF Transcript_11717/g.17185 Transcript_11717/m.17185 type:complete len:299 (-) Transcript_11717:94-990(-)|eukprot:CAMPEP_0194213056 /NCGR_PEP_ID=MMETSP0156-20130528/13360_1 /TAXON_ID=33649 /ORGANISM="Thalassionema nitzschioides, Strain L26-B" /LENGTH=298 /DNA_ID=CAMNT_0038941001 /DNA_START=62 /DNA_END=958 /DNA_ORIENTATION=-
MIVKSVDVDLYIATRVVEKPDLDIIDSYLKAGANANGPRGCSNSPLCHASCHGHEGLVRLLLEHGAKVDTVDASNGRTALMEASRNNHIGILDLLLEYGASIDQYTGTQGRTALIWACIEGHILAVSLLLQYGAQKQKEALWWASRYGHVAVVELLLHQLEKDDDMPSGDDEDAIDTKWHPLLVASALGHEEVVKVLLKQKIWETNTAMLAASQRGHEGVVKIILLEKNQETETITTAVQLASKSGHVKVVHALMQVNNASEIVSAINDGCETAMSMAIEHGHLGVQRCLRQIQLLQK